MVFGNKSLEGYSYQATGGNGFFVLSSRDSIEFQIRSAIMKVTIVG